MQELRPRGLQTEWAVPAAAAADMPKRPIRHLILDRLNQLVLDRVAQQESPEARERLAATAG